MRAPDNDQILEKKSNSKDNYQSKSNNENLLKVEQMHKILENS